MAHQNRNMSKKKKAVADGVFNSELNEFLTRQLDADGYTGVQVRVTPIRTEIVIQATRAREIVGEKGRRINELTTLIERRFRFREGSVELNVKRVDNRGMCADAQAESLRFKLLKGLAVRRACYGVVRFIMDNGATGCEVVVSGKLRAQRAKAMKFRDGYLISSGEPKNQYIQYAVRHVLMRQGVLGIKVKIMLAYDKEGVNGCSMLMPDKVIVSEPKEDEVIDHQAAVENPDAEEAVDEEVHQEAKELVEQEMEEQAQQEQQQAEEQQQEQQVVEEQPQQEGDNNFGGGYNQGYNNNGEQGGYNNRGSKGYGGKGGKGKGGKGKGGKERQNNDWNNNQSGGNNWGSGGGGGGGNWGGNWNN